MRAARPDISSLLLRCPAPMSPFPVPAYACMHPGGAILWYDVQRREWLMNRKEFGDVRHHLGKTQKQMAQMLGISLKAVQSFEQGWRSIPIHIERQLLFLLTLRRTRSIRKTRACWAIKKCSQEIRENCPAWEFQDDHFCWLINGTICEGRVQESWQKKMSICRRCEVFQSMLAGS